MGKGCNKKKLSQAKIGHARRRKFINQTLRTRVTQITIKLPALPSGNNQSSKFMRQRQ